MELLKMTSAPVIPRKRPLECSNDCKLEELRKRRRKVQAVRDFPPGCGIKEEEMKIFHSNLGNDKLVVAHPVETSRFNGSKPRELGINKPSLVSRPQGKVKFWDPTCTKAGYDQKPKVTTTIGMQKKLVKDYNNADSDIRKMASNGKGNLVNSHPVESRKLKCFEPKESGRNKPYLSLRSTGKVKYWDPKEAEAQKSDVATPIVSKMEQVKREKIQELLATFDQVYGPLCQENKLKPNIPAWSLPMEAAKIVKQMLKWVDPEKIVGPVCGVQIGDKFKYRSQLQMVGLHCQPKSGIDYANIDGKNLAISIVDAHRYSNESGCSDALVYSGQGGLGLFGCKSPPEDQKLERGNLALKNSMDKKTVVRVIRKVEGFGKDVFVYDGLYTVKHYRNEKSAEGKMVFKFHLDRVAGQPSLHKMLKW